VGASLAFSAGLERYRREDYVLLSYHVHIPLPDPMVNPATLARQKFYGVNSSPSYFVDGESSGGGGSADMAKSLFETKIDPMVAKHLAEPPEASLKLAAQAAGSTVKVKTTVSKVPSKSDKLRLQVALVEDLVRYNGENGLRFHDMVVRAMAEPPAAAGARTAPAAAPKPDAATKPATTRPDPANADAAQPEAKAEAAPVKVFGFPMKPGQGGTFEYAFDLKKAEAEALAHLQDFETNTRKGQYSFRQKKHAIDASRLSVVVFVQDEATKKILQAVYLKVPAGKAGKPAS
jgi:hypothetical protein